VEVLDGESGELAEEENLTGVGTGETEKLE